MDALLGGEGTYGGAGGTSADDEDVGDGVHWEHYLERGYR